MGPGGLRQGKVRSQEVTTSTLDTPSTSRSISPEKSAQIFTHLSRFCMGALDIVAQHCPEPEHRLRENGDIWHPGCQMSPVSYTHLTLPTT